MEGAGMIYVAFVPSLDTPFNRLLHCDPNLGYTFDYEVDEGGWAAITLEKKQTGWAINLEGSDRCIIVSESVTGDPADAVVIARARIETPVGDIFAPTQTLSLVCAPEDISAVANADDGTEDGAIMVFARTLVSKPETCLLLDDTDKDDPATYLLGRSAVYYIDPVTHEVSLSDMITGDRIINMSAAHFHDDQGYPEVELVEGQGPVGRARVTLRAGWTQQAKGRCDIAARLGDVWTYSPDFITDADTDMPNGVDLDLGAGWSLGPSRVYHTSFDGPTFFSGRVFEQDYVDQGTYAPDTSPQTYSMIHKEQINLIGHVVRFQHVFLEYEYTQEREELVHVVVDLPVQGVAGAETEIDEGEVSTIDLHEEPGAEVYDTGDWYQGDHVVYGGKRYECLEDHVSTSFWQKPDDFQWHYLGPTPEGYSHHPYWKQVPSQAVLRNGDYAFADKDAGQEVIGHLVARLRKKLLERARSLHITLTYPWHLARDITLRDSVMVTVPWVADNSTRLVVGKVIRLQKHWGEDGQWIVVKIAVSLAQGVDGEPVGGLLQGYTADDYFADDYTEALPADAFSVAGDTTFIVDADKVKRPIDTGFLPSPTYSVRRVVKENQQPEQHAVAVAAASRRKDCRRAVQEKPTRLKVSMIPLVSENLLSRRIFVAGQVVKATRGIDLINGEDA
jgi:hypothetical protein